VPDGLGSSRRAVLVGGVPLGGLPVGSLAAVIVGVGIDVVDMARFSRQLERVPGLAERLFTDDERELPPHSLAARFAAKEAVAKALGAPVGLRWTDCSVRRESDGRPHLVVRGTVAARAAVLGIDAFHLSLSHDAGIASAVVVAERRGPAADRA
jgi:holo-[acyl-carrier protein] synthase